MGLRRPNLGGLARMLRLAEPGEYNLGQVLAAAPDLAAELGLSKTELARLCELPDHELAPELSRHLDERMQAATALRLRHVRDQALDAARALSDSARWSRGMVVLEPRPFFALLVDISIKHIRLSVDDTIEVTLSRSLLRDIAETVGSKPDLFVAVNEAGLHLRWRNGRGGLDLRSRPVPVHERDRVFTVVLRPAPERVRAPRPRRREGAWLRDVLTELGLHL